MSNSAGSPQNPGGSTTDPFGGDDVLPIEKQRRAHQFLTQETRYHIIQAVPGIQNTSRRSTSSNTSCRRIAPPFGSISTDSQKKQLMTKYTYRGDEAGQHDPREFWGSPPMVSPS